MKPDTILRCAALAVVLGALAVGCARVPETGKGRNTVFDIDIAWEKPGAWCVFAQEKYEQALKRADLRLASRLRSDADRFHLNAGGEAVEWACAHRFRDNPDGYAQPMREVTRQLRAGNYGISPEEFTAAEVAAVIREKLPAATRWYRENRDALCAGAPAGKRGKACP